MKEKLIQYYGIIMVGLYILVNTLLYPLVISGILYTILVFFILLFNLIVLTDNNDKIKFKELIILFYFIFNIGMPKNSFQFLFGLMSMLTLIIKNFKYKSIKIISLIILILTIVFRWAVFIIFAIHLFSFSNTSLRNSFIYDDMHYKCDNNMEVYAYSAGAMDSYHFSTRKKFEILNINGIIHINYLKEKDITNDEYHNYIKKNECKLIGDKRGFKKDSKLNKN